MKTHIGIIGIILLAGCKQFEWPKCAGDDPECWAQHLNIYDEGYDYPYDTVSVDVANIPYTGSGMLPSGSSVDYPYYTSTNYPHFEDTTFPITGVAGYSTTMLEFNWEDPTKWSPSHCICFSCPRNVRCIKGHCKCTKGHPDGIFSGTWKAYISFNAEPADSHTEVPLDMISVPVSSATSTDEPAESLKNNEASKVKVGPQLGTKILIRGKDVGGGSGGSGGGAGGSSGGGGIDYSGAYSCNVSSTTPSGTVSGQASFSCGGGSCSASGTPFSGSYTSSGYFTGTTSLCATCNTLNIQGQMSVSGSFTLSGSAGSSSITMNCRKS